MKRFFLCVAFAALVSNVCAEGSAVDTTRIYELQEIEVKGTRADRTTPGAFTELSQRDVEDANFGADMPTLLQGTPSLVATSDAGNGIGGTAFRMRGADATRINVTANGVPLNDAESHSTYWYDTPDFASSVGTVQIQRGAGTSTNGTGAFGGSVNIATSPLSSEFGGQASLSYGSYNTNKQSVQINSGLLGKHWIVDGRLSHICSDGYVDRAKTDMGAYMFQTGYYKGRTMVKFLSFGGVAKVGLAYDGVTKDMLKDRVLRRFNSQGLVEHADGSVSYFDDQTDNYTQINNQLIVNHRFNGRWELNATTHYTYGYGFYNQWRNGDDPEEYGFTEFVEGADPIRKKLMDNHFFGAVASARYTSHRFQLTLGGAASVYDGKHWGTMQGVNYYRNASTKYDGNLYAKASYEVARGLHLYGDMQYRGIQHNIVGTNDNFSSVTDALQMLNIHRSYDFFNPKAGVNYTWARNHRAYVSFAVAHKEPNRSNFTDTKLDEFPLAERLYDWEFGYGFRNKRFDAGVNFYYMSYKDQLVATGELSDTGEAMMRNVARSYRRGIEVMADLDLTRWFTLGGNVTLSQNRIRDFSEYVSEYDADWNYLSEKELPTGESTLSYSPSLIAALELDFHVSGFSARIKTRYVSKQYLTNARVETLTLPEYCVTDLDLGYTYKNVRFGVQLNNIFDVKYASNGYGYSSLVGGERQDEAYYLPQAMFNVLANITFLW